MIKKIILLFLFINITFGCTKDDICSGETPTTPKLVITFKSNINPNLFKQVNNLTVSTLIDNENIEIIKSTTTDSIAIPMNPGVDMTEFQFINNNTSSNPGNTDNVSFSYQRNNVYINRACAFKTIYENLVSQLEVEENENWIREIIVNQTTVEDENITHVIIFH